MKGQGREILIELSHCASGFKGSGVFNDAMIKPISHAF